MPYKDIEKQKAHAREYNKKHKEQKKIYDKKYHQKHKKEINAYQLKYYYEHRKQNKIRCQKYQREHREEINKWQREYHRHHRLKVKGKHVYGLNKRGWKGYCELCGREDVHLAYHHWDDGNPEKGIWVCNIPCHQICEIVDKEQLHLIQRYLKFKRFLDREDKKNVRKSHNPTRLCS